MTAALLRLLRVPPEPQAPDGSPESIRVFRAGRNYYRWRLFVWAATQILMLMGAVTFIGATLVATRKMPLPAQLLFYTLDGLIILWAIVGVPCSYLMQRLNYELRWYIVTDRSLRIRSGIWSVEEITMTFANIQDMRVTAGPLQGWLGLADLDVRSAGGGGAGPRGEHAGAGRSNNACFAGVDNAEAIRDLIAERLRRYKDAGLGDAEAPLTVDGAAAELLGEARALRKTLT